MDKRELIAQAAWERVGCGYIMGATGWVCTQARIDAQARQYPAYAAAIYKYGPKWIGKKCYDCAQLSRAAASAAGISLVSGATSQWNQNIWQEKGTMDTLPWGEPGIMLFRKDGTKMAHVAVYMGDGTEVEALGHQHGVVRRAIAGRTFTHWARLQGLDGAWTAPEVPVTVTMPTLRKGARGDYVAQMQTHLLGHGVPLPRFGADGQFGAETETAVRIFQGLNALKVDGICGPQTWTALLAEPDTTPEAALWVVTIPGLTEDQADGLLAVWPGAVKAVG